MYTMDIHEAATLLGVSDEDVVELVAVGRLTVSEDGYIERSLAFKLLASGALT